MTFQKAVQASLFAFLLYTPFNPNVNIAHSFIFMGLIGLIGWFSFLDLKKTQFQSEKALNEFKSVTDAKFQMLEQSYQKRLERMEDEIGKLSITLVQRSSGPSFVEKQTMAGKKIQF